MVVLRVLGTLIALAALGLLGLDLIQRLFADAEVLARPAGQAWVETFGFEQLNLVQALIQRYLLPEVWTPIQWVLEQPVGTVRPIVAGTALVSGLVIAFAGRRRRR